jgi:hypothetical protein
MDVSYGLLCCFLDAMDGKRTVALEPVLESPHGLGCQVFIDGVEEDILPAVFGVVLHGVQGKKLMVCLFFLDLGFGRCVDAMDASAPGVPHLPERCPEDIDHPGCPLPTTGEEIGYWIKMAVKIVVSEDHPFS